MGHRLRAAQWGRGAFFLPFLKVSAKKADVKITGSSHFCENQLFFKISATMEMATRTLCDLQIFIPIYP